MALSLTKAGVAGAGAMGLGIAQMLAQTGLQVVLYDVSEAQLEKAQTGIIHNLDVAISKGKLVETEKTNILSQIVFSSELSSLKGELVIEAIVEKLEAKQELFKKLAELNGADTILATNTSSIPVTRIARGIANPERVAGMHFFNPAHIMKLVEIITGAETSTEVVETLRYLF